MQAKRDFELKKQKLLADARRQADALVESFAAPITRLPVELMVF